MGKDYSPKLFLSVRGVKEHVNSKSISYEEFTKNQDYSPGVIKNVQRALLPFDYLGVEAIINGKEEIIKLTAYVCRRMNPDRFRLIAKIHIS